MRALLPTMIAMTLTATAVDADTALIIANTRYQEAQNLRDADDFLRLEEPLAEAGFDVIVLRNGDSAEIRAALSQLLRAGETERIVIAAAGHFLRSGRETWLMGRESDTPDLATVSATGAPLSVMAEIAANAPGRALIMLGLESRQFDTGPVLERDVAIPDVPQGVTVIAGSPDDLRRFASQELLRPGRDLATALSEGDDLTVFGFVSPSLPFIDVAETAAPPAPAPQPVISVAEVALWDAAQELDTVSAYRAYLVRYPSGGFVNLAQDRIAVLEGNDAASQAEAIEDALGLSRDDRRAIQGDLAVLGFDTRGVDGIFGGGTRGAIRDWQQREGV